MSDLAYHIATERLDLIRSSCRRSVATSDKYPLITMDAADVLALLAAVAERDALAAKLDADGLPVVTTVGDLTARHIGRRVRVNGTVRNIISVAHTRDGSTVLHLQPGSRSDVCLETASVTPCEVLP